MFKFLKRLLSEPKIITPEIKNEDLITKINEVLSTSNLEEILSNPTSKIYILNVYHTTFDELLQNLLQKNSNRPLIATNVYSYFKGNNISYKFNRLKKHLETNDIDILIQNELTEVLDSILYLKEIHRGK